MQTLAINGEMTIFTVGEHKPQLLKFLSKRGKAFELSLSGVTEMDTAGLQLLILLKREAAQAGKSLRYVMHSQAVLEVLELANLTSSFGDQVVLAHEEE